MASIYATKCIGEKEIMEDNNAMKQDINEKSCNIILFH